MKNNTNQEIQTKHFQGVSLCFSTFTLAAISIDRFLLIRYPMQKPFNHAQASIAIIVSRILYFHYAYNTF